MCCGKGHKREFNFGPWPSPPFLSNPQCHIIQVNTVRVATANLLLILHSMEAIHHHLHPWLVVVHILHRQVHMVVIPHRLTHLHHPPTRTLGRQLQ